MTTPTGVPNLTIRPENEVGQNMREEGLIMSTVAVTDESFESDVLKSDKPVVVDFWAEWCGPCKQIGPSLEEIAAEMGEDVVIAKVNIDDNPNAPSRYGVRGIPTMILFKDGEATSTKVGAAPKTAIESWIKESI